MQSCVAPEAIGNDRLVESQNHFAESATGPFLAWNEKNYLISWSQQNTGERTLASRLLTLQGDPSAPSYEFPAVDFLANGRSAAWTGSEFGVVWFERDGGAYSIRWGRIDKGGSPIGQAITLASNASGVHWPHMVWTGTEFGVVWTDGSTGVSQVMFARLASDGTLLGAPEMMTTSFAHSRDPRLVWTGSEYGLAWTDEPFDDDSTLRFQRLDSDGEPIGATTVIGPIVARGFSGPVWTGADYALTYRSDADGDTDVYFQRIDAGGALLGGAVQVTIDTEPSLPGELVWNGEEFGMVWLDGETGVRDVLFRTLDALGNPGAIVPLTDDDTIAAGGASMVWSGAEYAVAWYDNRDGDNQVYLARIGCDCSTDQDSDLVSSCNDCDEFEASVFPGALQTCDGLNNDCAHPNYPSLVDTNEADDDGDGVTECTGDCDDTNPAVFGGPEINDGIDNDCPGAPGFGVADDTSGDSGFHLSSDSTQYDWETQDGATLYEIARSELPTFATCTSVQLAAPPWIDPQLPALGGVFYYLNRPSAPFPGSWGVDSDGTERAFVCD